MYAHLIFTLKLNNTRSRLETKQTMVVTYIRICSVYKYIYKLIL